MDILEIIGAVGLPVIAAIVFFISRGKGSSADSVEKRADRNYSDLRGNLESDRERELRENLDIKRERNIIEQERRASRRTGSIISNARKSISSIIRNSKGTGKD